MKALLAAVVGLAVWFVGVFVFGFVVASIDPAAEGAAVQVLGQVPALVAGAAAALVQRVPERGPSWAVWGLASVAGPVVGALASALFVASTITGSPPNIASVVGALVAAALGAGLAYGARTYRRIG